MSQSKKKKQTLEEIWWGKFDQVKAFYRKEGHLTIPDRKLSSWLNYQRHGAKALSIEQLQALESIHYKNTKPFRKSGVEEWEDTFKELVSKGSTKGSKKLQMWLSNQRKLAASNELSQDRQERLEAHGFDMKSPIQHKSSNFQRAKINEKKWLAQFQNLKKYHQKHGNCNVPFRFQEDPTLGNWVANQRKAYHSMSSDGESKQLSQDRITKLESIGFQWELKKHQPGFQKG